MRGLQRADHELVVTVCRRHLRGIVSSGRARGRPRGRTVPGRVSGHRGEGSPGRYARLRPWNGAWRRVARLVARRTGNPSAASAVGAIIRVIGAASALSAWRRGYGKEKVYGSIP
jgi:hypothetical protein